MYRPIQSVQRNDETGKNIPSNVNNSLRISAHSHSPPHSINVRLYVNAVPRSVTLSQNKRFLAGLRMDG